MRVPYLVWCNLLLLLFIYVPTALAVCSHSFYLRIPFLHVSSCSIRLFNTRISILAQHLILDVQKMESEKINCLIRQQVETPICSTDVSQNNILQFIIKIYRIMGFNYKLRNCWIHFILFLLYYFFYFSFPILGIFYFSFSPCLIFFG